MAAKHPRVNVTVTPEQHALLIELANLNGGSAAGFLRSMLDQVTPLLRATVPALKQASEEMNLTRDQALQQISVMLAAVREAGAVAQPDLLDAVPPASAADERSASDVGRGPRRGRRP